MNMETNHDSETRVCSRCGEELPLSDFRKTKLGNRSAVCMACIQYTAAQTRGTRRSHEGGGGDQPPFSDPDFDGKQPVEVIQLMTRAKRWLEARGYAITLRGEYREVKVRQIKFQ